jgi:hypothetical protein
MMPRKCLVCTHSEREEIDKDLVGGLSFRKLSRRFKIDKSSLFRHKRNHLPITLVKAEEAREVARSGNLWEQIEDLRLKATRIAKKAEEKGDFRAALLAVRELTRIIELLAKLQGDLKEQTVNVVLNAQWIELRTTILSALREYPEARLKLAEVLENAS